jgi:hypothetical protein
MLASKSTWGMIKGLFTKPKLKTHKEMMDDTKSKSESSSEQKDMSPGQSGSRIDEVLDLVKYLRLLLIFSRVNK